MAKCVFRVSNYLCSQLSNFAGFALDAFCIPEQCKADLDSVIIPGGLLRDRQLHYRIERLAQDIANDYSNEPFTAICVLRGGLQLFYLLLDKIREIYRFSKPESVDYLTTHIRVEFVRLKSYVNDKSTELEISGLKNFESLRGKNLLIVEDIIDTGKSMDKFFEKLSEHSPKSSRLVVLATKEIKTCLRFEPHYIGFIIPDRFIVGCNFEYNDYYRDIQHVCLISETAKQKYAVKQSSE
ncbi:hypoxanthine-guanine phosphoribosyltransferase-like protein [Leptotrombidium deliense]|uniref:Hypoxanthine-guanine phosphoribosyltransferase-like protein n=1 Tax=Leptotrombidium deliense TaxID=299467 RepID=A0A443SNR1_9ACAR|nr:hypoxanthine-guanine phosphoribosyltransferase-like protein [Leptotrombidium deliense]